MAIPSGSGTEVLRRGAVNVLTDGNTQLNFTGVQTAPGATQTVPANHIITMINMLFSEAADSAETIDILVYNGAASITLLYLQPIAAKSTFVWNTKFVMHGATDYCSVISTAGNVDVYYTYLDQDWS